MAGLATLLLRRSGTLPSIVVQFTNRDKIWNTALKEDEIHPSAFAEAYDMSERTARDTLETMHEMGVLEKHGSQGERVTYSSLVDHPVP